MKQPISLGILLFDEVEVLDFAGPFEVFTKAGMNLNPKPFDVFTLAAKLPVKCRDGLSVNPDFLLEQAPSSPILLVPGGPGARRELAKEDFLQWLRKRAAQTELLLSVCTGALILAKAGLVEGLELTTRQTAVEELRALAPNAKIRTDQRYVDHGRVMLSAGVAAGIDLSLHVVRKILGEAAARETADNMEYPWP